MFYLPFVYGIFSRCQGLFYKITFFVITIFPILYFVILSNDEYVKNLMIFSIAFLAIYSVYEIGYLFNDIYTVNFENNPTFRLENKYFEIVKQQFPLLIAVRIFYTVLCLFILSLFEVYNLELFYFLIVLLNLSYAIHNTYRNKINIITMFFIVGLKYVAIPVLFYPLGDYFTVSFILILIIPFLRSIEYASKKKFDIDFLKKLNVDTFRISYYSCIVILCFVLSFFYRYFLFGAFLGGVFLLFRIGILIILKIPNIKNKINYIRKINKNI
ncbi:hypothetical protein [Propionispira raffinosivorans]|uniref:hypothetical protein n=1 Tax=Propionispira raffinosivorans TaxID=86959 RepID=UPI00035CA3D1|nr:hypothetical protein [Propionispira raffinosivorans]